MKKKCSFCGGAESSQRRLLGSGINNESFICVFCIEASYRVFLETSP